MFNIYYIVTFMNIKYLKIELIPGRSVTFAKPPTAKSILGLFRKYNCTEVELKLFCSMLARLGLGIIRPFGQRCKCTCNICWSFRVGAFALVNYRLPGCPIPEV